MSRLIVHVALAYMIAGVAFGFSATLVHIKGHNSGTARPFSTRRMHRCPLRMQEQGDPYEYSGSAEETSKVDKRRQMMDAITERQR